MLETGKTVAMASKNDNEKTNQVVPEDDDPLSVKSVQSRYLRSPSPSMHSVISDTESVFLEPIHLSSAVAAKQIISKELKPKEVKVKPVPESMLESAEQLMVEDLYNRVKDMMDDSSPYNTPCVLDIQRTIVQDRLEAPFNPADEVWPNIFIGEKTIAVNKSRLKRMGVTHILNAAHGTGVYTGPDFYTGMNIQYMGLEVDDFPDAAISHHLRPAAEFLDEALLTHKGKVLVSSVMGESRSPVLVAAYLMIFHNMTIMEALLTIKKKRPINPNEGFLKQLRDLNEALLKDWNSEDDSETVSQGSVIEVLQQQSKEESIMGARAHSIQVEEDEGLSMISSVMSQKLDHEMMEDRCPTVLGEVEESEDGEDDLDQVIREWQKRNEQYQSENWWKAQLMSEDEESLLGGSCMSESIKSADIQALKEQVKGGTTKMPHVPNSVITEASSSFSDMWKQRLKETERQAAARYNSQSESENQKNNREEDEESQLSETASSLFNFCTKNKDKLTPLERWQVKRIQFGWNKKDDAGKDNEEQRHGVEEQMPLTSEVNLTAYQTWKLKQQKRLGLEDKNEVVELSRAEDTAMVKRRQRRKELLERSRQTLEESQSICGWDTESSSSVTSIPISSFWPSAANRSAAEDNASMLSLQSGKSSVLSHTGAVHSQPTPQVPLIPGPKIQASGGEALDLASIQNWIANVVTETLIQKQGEMMMGHMSPAGSVLSGVTRSGSAICRHVDDDKVSILSGASFSRDTSHSMLSLGSMSTPATGSCRGNVTRTSVPLYSLFHDQVDLKKLDSMSKEMKSEMREKMGVYEIKKVAEDNKRSTLFKKKKAKEGEEKAEGSECGYAGTSTILTSTQSSFHRLGKHIPSVGDKSSSITRWLTGVSASPGSHIRSSRKEDFQQSSFTSEEECTFDFKHSATKDHKRLSHDKHLHEEDLSLARQLSTSYSTEEYEDEYQKNAAKRKFVQFCDMQTGPEEHDGDNSLINRPKLRSRVLVEEETDDAVTTAVWMKKEKSNVHFESES